MNIQKTWSTIIFSQGDVEVEVSMNYMTKKFTICNIGEDQRIYFGNDHVEEGINRAKCIMAAMKYIKQELEA